MATTKTPISVLQEMAQVKRIPQPVYDVQPKGNEFCVTLKLGKNEEIFAEAVAKTKQLAKQLCAKNALEKLNNESADLVQDEQRQSNKLSENHVGKLNELCCKTMVAVPKYNECGSENGEFIIECVIFDNTVTRGQSRTKKDAKQKAAEAMLRVYSESEENLRRRTMELKESCSPPNESFHNYVGELNELCSKRQEMIPSYTECGTNNGEFIIECKTFDDTITRGQSKTKKEAKQKAAQAMLSQIGESENQKIATSSDEVINLHKSKSSTVPFENYVGKLSEICVKKMLQIPIYIEVVTENQEFTIDCKVIYNSVSNVTRGQSRSKKAAKENAAEEMFKILTESLKLESQNLMKSVTIVENVDNIRQKPTGKLTEHIATVSSQSDLSSVVHMNEEQLKIELKNLNVIYRITSVEQMKNVVMLKTKPTRNCKSFTFIAKGQDNVEVNLDLLRKAVLGVRILMINL